MQAEQIDEAARTLRFGDMLLVDRAPLKLMKALAVIACELHRGFDHVPRIETGKSKESCVLCSLAVRDFLRAIGFERARVAPVCTAMWASDNGEPLHSLGIGHPEDKRCIDGHWVGHLVVIAAGFIIDTTLYRAIRPAWPHLPPMIALPLCRDGAERQRRRWMGLELLAGASVGDSERPGYELDVYWFDNPVNTSWRHGPDCERARRLPVVHELVETWREGTGLR